MHWYRMEVKSLINSRNRLKPIVSRIVNLYHVLRMTYSPAFWYRIRKSISLYLELFRSGVITVKTLQNKEVMAESMLFLSGDINVSISTEAYQNNYETLVREHIQNQQKVIQEVWFLPEVIFSALGHLTTLSFYRNEVWGIFNDLVAFFSSL